jgi:hypothetical protein
MMPARPARPPMAVRRASRLSMLLQTALRSPGGEGAAPGGWGTDTPGGICRGIIEQMCGGVKLGGGCGEGGIEPQVAGGLGGH